MRGGEAIIKALKKQGVDTIFGYPGGQVLPFYDMLSESDLNHILVRHEQCAAHAADGYARASGKVGVCLSTSGPGATNLVTGLATAFMDSSPVIAISGQVPSSLIGNDAFQEADIVGITMPIVKHSYQPDNVDLIPSIINSGFKIASTGRPGPVLIDVPIQLQTTELDDFVEDLIDNPGYNPKIKADFKEIQEAINIIKNAKKPLILAGGGVIISNASEELKEFSYIINAPIMTSLLGKGAIDEFDEMSLGMLGMHGRKVANYNINDCDCLIAIGTRFSDRTTGNVEEFIPNSTLIHIDIDPAEIGKNIDVDLSIVGDAKEVLIDLINNLKGFKSNQDAINWVKYLNEYKNKNMFKYTFDDIPLKPQQIIYEISSAISSNDILTTDVGQNQMWAGHFFNTEKPRKFISSGGLGTMGFGFPAAIGAKVACPEDAVVTVTGDGGFLMVAQELATIKQYDIPVIIAILNNKRLGMIKQFQHFYYNNNFYQSDLSSNPDFVKLAESFGINAVRIEKVGETENIIKKSIKDNESILLDIVIDSEEYLPMVPPNGVIDKMIGEYELQGE